MSELQETLELWLDGHEMPPGHPVEPSWKEVLKAFYALLLVGTGLRAASPEPLLERLLPGLPFRRQDRPSRTVVNLGLCRRDGLAHELQRQLRGSLSAEQAESWLRLLN